MKTITLFNQKGGVAKTTTASALASGLKKKGYKVLLIDMDSQANLTQVYDALEAEHTSLELLTGTPAEQTITHTEQGDIIAADSNLYMVMPEEMHSNSYIGISATALKEALEPLQKTYDYCIIDTPPALSIITTNALIASNELIIPSEADVFSIRALGKMLEIIQNIKSATNSKIKIAGILLTKFSSRGIVDRDVEAFIKQVADANKVRFFNTRIRKGADVRKAQGSALDILNFAPNSNVALDYTEFVEEYLKGEK